MKRRILSITVALLLVISGLPVGVNGAARGDETDKLYGSATFENPVLVSRLQGAIVYRVNNTEAYANNERIDLDFDYENLKTYERDGTIFIPLMFSLKQIGIPCSETDAVLTVTYQGQQHTIKEGDTLFGSSGVTEIAQHRLFISAKDFAKVFSKQYFEYKDVVIISDTEEIFNPDDSADLKLLNEVRDSMGYEWGFITMGPNGFVTGLFVHPKDTSIKYARTDVGGFYKWSNLSNRWVQLGSMFGLADNTQSFTGIMSIGLDPNDTQTLYIAAGLSLRRYTTPDLHDVFKSTDGGRTWRRTYLNKFINANGANRVWGESLAVDPNNSNIVYCGTAQDGLFVSTDAGGSWKPVTSVPIGDPDPNGGGINNVMFDPNSPVIDGKTSRIYVGVSGTGIYTSTNGGDSFGLMPGSPIYPKRFDICHGKFYCSSGHLTVEREGLVRGFFKYEDNKWIDLTPSIAGNKNFNSFVVSPDDPNVLLIFQQCYTNPKYMYRSLDGGKSWENMGAIRQISRAIINPDNTKEVIYSWGFGIQVIENILAPIYTIRNMDDGVEELVTNQVLSIRNYTKNKVISAVWDMGFAFLPQLHDRSTITVNDGVIGKGFDAEQCEGHPKFVVRCGTKGSDDGPTTMFMSEDYGNTWQASLTWPNNAAGNNIAISPTVQENGYPIVLALSTNNANRGIFRSKDYGKTWEKLDIKFNFLPSVPNHEGQYLESDKVDGKTFYFMDIGLNLYKTTDAGDTWNIVSGVSFTGGYNYSTYSQPALHAANGVEGFLAISTKPGLYLSRDGGSNFSRHPDFSEVGGVCFGKNRPGSRIPAMFVFGNYKGIYSVYISDDLGKTFRRIGDGSNNVPTRIHSMEGDANVYGRVFFATDGAGVYYGQPIDVDDELPKIKSYHQNSSDVEDADYAVRDKNFTLSGELSKKAEVRVNNIPQELNSQYQYHAPIELAEGMNRLRVEALDSNKQKATPVYLDIRHVPNYVGITFDFDVTQKIMTKSDSITFSGRINTPGTVYINDTAVAVGEDLRFSQEMTLNKGVNTFEIYAQATDGYKSKTATCVAEYDVEPPTMTITEIAESVDKNYVLIKGTLSEPSQMRFNGVYFETGSKSEFISSVPVAMGDNEIKIEAKDLSGNVTRPQYFNVNCTSTGTGAKSNLDVKYVPDSEITLDGELTESSWVLDKEINKVTTGYKNNHATFDLSWSDTGLYIAAHVFDSYINNATANTYDGDTIEVYIDGANRKASSYDNNSKQLFFVSDGSFSTTGTQYKAKLTDYGYQMEMFIPWTMFNVKFGANSLVGFDIDYCDNDGGDTRAGVATYHGTGNNWKDTSAFATLKLVK